MVTMLKNILGITVLISLLFPNFILAQIIADKNASIANQPSILQTPNKAVQIDIVKPSKDGVSMNEYSKFNTLKTGTVLNNSKKGTNSITGGYIQANPPYNSDKKDTQTPKPASTKSKICSQRDYK
ncbi:filamentous hemagglutinin N-terminal domain-containing protein [Campylobacter geochelonis]|uniref:filamentous hemagglutinin N-terminal domain-containing protein n=1 Tax=Campylobacter geochelonis TaxID=1780362 RepID=UPI000770AB7D|nr:filamentous hemagglutinin N-terminal domain-containing protein [Campylobacter geochelonis]CZE49739.1 hemagglutination activity domain-containing protein [Campylobacter geochelonis]